MAATATPVANGTPSYGEAVKRVTSIPLVSESLTFAQSTIDAHPFLLARPYHLGQSVVTKGLDVAQPVTARISPQLQIADQWAVKSLNFAESKVPYPFHATYNDLYSAARYPADQTLQLIHAYAAAINKAYDERILSPAKSVYSSRVAPYVQAAEKNFQDLQAQNAYVARAVELTQGLVNNLQQQVNTIQSGSRAQADAASKKAQATSQAIFAELDRVRSFAQALPAESRKRFDPALQTFTDAYETLRREALDSKVPAQERLNRIVAYVREQTIPALQKSLSNGSAPQANGVAK